MKKILIMTLVLGIVSAASAAVVTYQFRDAAGTTPISEVNFLSNPNFTLVITGDYNDLEAGQIYLYDEYENSSVGSNVADMTNAVKLAASGGGGAISPYDPTYDGYVLNWGDPTGQSGDMFVISLTASTTGTVNIGEYASDYTTLLATHSIDVVIPEPMTVALLGLGGLFLRRRKQKCRI